MSDAPRRAFLLQLGLVAVAIIGLLGLAVVVLRGDDDATVAADGASATTSPADSSTTDIDPEPAETASPSSTAPLAPLTTLDFGAPTTVASTTTETTEVETTTTTSTTTTTAPPTTTSTTQPLGPRQDADPGPTISTEAGAHGPMSVALGEARRRWRAQGPAQGYVYRTQRICFCPRADNEISVDARGEVVGQTTRDGDPERDPMSIDEVFDQLEAAIRSEAASIEASFDEDLGFPVTYSIDYDEQIADDELGRDIDWVAARVPPTTTTSTTSAPSTTSSTTTTTTEP